MSIEKISRECVASSSIKGFPRIFKSESQVLSFFWLLGSVALICICVVQTHNVVKEYLDYPFTTTIAEIPLESVESRSTIIMPDILICNLNPFASNTDESPKDIPTVQDYLHALEKFTGCPDGSGYNCMDISQELNEITKGSIGYFQYVGSENAGKLAQGLNDFLLECSLTILKGSRLKKVPCLEYIRIRERANEEFFRCYDFNFPAQLQDSLSRILGISMSIYLDNFYDPFASARWLDTEGHHQDMAMGLLLYLYESGTLPTFTTNHVYAAPGMLTDIKFMIEEVERLESPYGDCFNSEDHKLPTDIIGSDVKYSANGCMAYCTGLDILKRCKCIDVEITGTLFLRYGSVHLSKCIVLDTFRVPYFRISCAKTS